MSMRWLLIFCGWVIAGCALQNASAGARACTLEESKNAERIAATATSWKQAHQHFQTYGHCDDGAIAEGFSESVGSLLAEHWGAIGDLASIIQADPKFQTFVIRHINQSISTKDLKAISINAEERCPMNLKRLCRDIQAAAARK